MRFGILGPLEVRTDDGTPVDPGGPRPRALLSLLLLDAGRPVSAERLIDGLYGSAPPTGSANALQSQISRLRRRLAPHADIEATPTGYRLAVPPDAVDAHRFERLAAQGRAALSAGDHQRAAAVLRDALALWRGPALADLRDARGDGTRLEELRLTAVQDRIEAELALGGGGELVPELRASLSAHPLSERLYGQLMRALHAGGRPAEALTVYEEARRTLADELGADPSPELSALHGELLRGRETERRRVPVQLTRFVGREAELARVAALLAESRLVTLTGAGGAGKTRLAIEAASAHAHVCFVELAPVTDARQLPYAVLTALGVRDGFRGPTTDTTDRLLAALEDRELLLVLDNCEHLVEETANWFSVGETVRILIGLGRTAAAEGRAEEARDWFRQAAELAVEGPGELELAEAAEALASVADPAERAAVLLGAATGLRGARAGSPDVVRTEREVRARLSPEAYTTAFERGRSLRSAAVSER